MNQILSMQSDMNNNKKNNNINNQKYKNKANVNSIVKVFAIFIMIYGLALIGSSSYAIITSTPKQKDNINVEVERIGIEATIRVTSERPIKTLSYRWNEGEEQTIESNGTIELESKVEIPDGNNILNIKVIDYYGNVSEYQKQYINERNDKTNPTIDMTLLGNTLNITAKDETEISYLTYRWNEGEEQRIDVDINSQDKKQIQTTVEVNQGENKLTITAVDKDGNKVTREEIVVGDYKPTFTVTTEGNNIVITAKDDEGISKIAITVDGVTTDTGDTPINQKEITAKQELEAGTHTITIVVTNVNGVKEEQSFTATL